MIEAGKRVMNAVTTEDLDRKLSEVYDRMNTQGIAMARVEENVKSTGTQVKEISETLHQLVRIDERFIQFVETDRESKARMWKHIETTENNLTGLKENAASSKLMTRILLGFLLATISAAVAFVARGG